jgi:squalene cyclase
MFWRERAEASRTGTFVAVVDFVWVDFSRKFAKVGESARGGIRRERFLHLCRIAVRMCVYIWPITTRTTTTMTTMPIVPVGA